MPWVIGLDEAGYGPNLGPFVMSAVAFHAPDALAAGDLWQALGAAVRHDPGARDGRLLVNDSKVVYSSGGGLLQLERGVLAALWPDAAAPPATLAALLPWLCPEGGGLCGEPWYTGATALPVALPPAELPPPAASFAACCAAAGLMRGPVFSEVICARRFNALLDEAGTKGAVLAEALVRLLRRVLGETPGDDALAIVIDKHGGRNAYAALLQHALPHGVVVTRREGMACSAYRVLNLGREVELTFRPRADADHFCVALASMASKYLRELLMREFNGFWRRHVPDLKPTAGYPGDAARYYEAIRPAAERLGIPESALWRRK